MALHRDPAPVVEAAGTPLTDSNLRAAAGAVATRTLDTRLASPVPIRRGLVVGQRYASDAEPELGLGVVVAVDERIVELVFPAADDSRRYVVKSAPIRRVRFVAGDTLADDAGRTHRVESVDERDGVLFYGTAAGELAESRVAARTAVTGPRERLASGRVDSSLLFDLRSETLTRLHDIRRSPVRGFSGPRIELLPHQFFVAAEVSSRLVPRVLLADETGLGKTIEAGLILSRLILAGRVSRALVLVPDSLVHQWLVELRRRFQLRFAVYDEERCKAFDESEPGSNPFAAESFVLAGLSLLTTKASRAREAAEAAWDLVVVDEAHHLEWSPDHASPGYRAVETVARRAGGLLLLTATPEQLGAEGHFARLQLLDPDRYGDYEQWSREAEGYRDAARVAAPLAADAPLDAAQAAELAAVLGDTDAATVLALAAHRPGRDKLLADLIDRHGPGRVMFRNTRAAVRGFPERIVHRYPLQPDKRLATGDLASLRERLATEVADDLASRDGAALRDEFDEFDDLDLHGPDSGDDDANDLAATPPAPAAAADTLRHDPRVDWLVRFLGPKGPRKVLVLCRTRAKCEALEAAIASRLRVATALFHEGLTLVQRDRGAAWFAEPDGARLMICSELGSEGRNFQHAQHLVLFDVPPDPDLVEQRIGRLDRIGQRGTVEIHVPFVAGSGFEVLVRWLDDGVDALRRPTLAARHLLEDFGARVRELANTAASFDRAALDAAIDELATQTAAAAALLAARVEQGRDRLLELASLRREVADPLIAAVRALDADGEFEDYFLRLLEHFHVYAEETQPRCYLLNPDGTQSPEFPSLDHGETVLVFERSTALVREDLQFATRDHPLLGDAMEALLASPAGNAAFALLDDDCAPRLWVEALFVLEPVAPARLHADRFLAPTPIRVVLDQHGKEPEAGEDPATADLVDGSGIWVAGNQAILAPLLTRIGARCDELAEERALRLRRDAVATMHAQLSAELDRIAALAEVNDHVDPDEAEALAQERDELAAAIGTARLRPDALRFVWQGPTRDGAPLLGKARR